MVLTAFDLTRSYFARDEGLYYLEAQRMLRGEVPYRDFFEFIGPGFLWVVRSLLSVFGEGVVAVRMMLLAVYAASACLLYHFAFRLTRRSLLSLLAPLYWVVVAKQATWWAAEHHALSNFGVLVAGALLLAELDRPRRWTALAIGVVTGLTSLTTQHTGALLGLASLALVALVFPRLLARGRAQAGWLALGALGPLVLVLGYLVFHRALGAAVECLVVWPFTGYRRFHAEPYFGAGFGEIAQLWTTKGVAAWRELLHLILVGLGPVVALTLGVARLARELIAPSRDPGQVQRSLERAIVVALALAMFLSIAPQPSAWAVMQSSALSFVVLLDLITPRASFLVARGPKTLPGLRRSPRHAAALVGLVLVTLVLSRSFRVQARSIHREQARGVMIETAFGPLRHPDPSTAAEIRALIDRVRERTSPDDAILVFHWSPQLYLVTGRRPAVRFSGLLPGYNSAAHFEEVASALRDQGPKLVIRDRLVETLVAESDARLLRLGVEASHSALLDRAAAPRYAPILEGSSFTVLAPR